jgi:hypothetical protein
MPILYDDDEKDEQKKATSSEEVKTLKEVIDKHQKSKSKANYTQQCWHFKEKAGCNKGKNCNFMHGATPASETSCRPNNHQKRNVNKTQKQQTICDFCSVVNSILCFFFHCYYSFVFKICFLFVDAILIGF